MADPIRLPNRDNVAIVEQLPDAGEIEKFLFNDIGGTELINLVRNDSVSGIDIKYSIISDLAQINLELNPTELLFGKGIYESILDSYAIRLSTRLPENNFSEYNQVSAEINLPTNAYFDGTNLVIEFENMNSNEFIEIQVMSDAATIYTMRENDY